MPATVIDHPLVKHHLTTLRDKRSTCFQFRHSLRQLSGFVVVEASRDIELSEQPVTTPIRETIGHRIAMRVGLIPILRAGLGMVEPVLELIPTAEVWHLGLYRDEVSAQPVRYYDKLVAGNSVDTALVLDPMLATGGSACAACQSLSDWGVRDIRMLSIIAAPEGIQRLNSEFPSVPIYTCVTDQCLDHQNFIVPGLGDAGDRLFNTISSA